MQCPIKKYCKAKCEKSIFKIIGKDKNHIECKNYKSKQ
jgi:hypothetical protein